ncbi:hypothetical protein FB451DRAFT_1470118, partial [Mycena latifolia]
AYPHQHPPARPPRRLHARRPRRPRAGAPPAAALAERARGGCGLCARACARGQRAQAQRGGVGPRAAEADAGLLDARGAQKARSPPAYLSVSLRPGDTRMPCPCTYPYPASQLPSSSPYERAYIPAPPSARTHICLSLPHSCFVFLGTYQPIRYVD